MTSAAETKTSAALEARRAATAGLLERARSPLPRLLAARTSRARSSIRTLRQAV